MTPDPSQLPTAPVTGALDPYFTELAADEEPVTVGTLFLCIIILMIVAAFWVILYLQLVER